LNEDLGSSEWDTAQCGQCGATEDGIVPKLGDELMKRLMYLSISILCLSVSLLIGFHFGASTARADYEPGGIVIGAQDGWILTSDGLGWRYSNGWERQIALDIPSGLVSQMKFWSPSTFVTTSDEVYIGGPDWINVGTPGDPTNIEPTTWGQLKGKYEDDN